MSEFFKQAGVMARAQSRIVETLGVPFADPFNEEAVIIDVNDPKRLGRVKVTTNDGFTSKWIPVSGSSSGTLSSRYIGSNVLVGKTNGRSENMYVIGIVKNDKNVGLNGSPFQLPIIDESMAVWNGSSDPGMTCNKENEGRAYILSNEMSQDVVVCLRRSSPQVGNEPSWAWKSFTNGLWIEKGINPGNETTIPIEQAQLRNPGIPECTESLLGEKHDFSEDRGFRTTSMVCRRDENGEFGWIPESSPPVFFRTTLPTCTEKLHGMEAVADDGNNSEIIKCIRYQGLMRWVKEGKRLPHKFHKKDKPPTKVEFLGGYKPVPALEESGFDWLKEPEIIETVFDKVISNIPLINTDPVLKNALQLAGLLPAQAFNGAQVLSSAAKEAMNRKLGIPVDTITNTIRQQLDIDGKLSPETAQILTGIGDAGRVLTNGVAGGTIDQALANIGQNALKNSLLSLNPQAASVMTGLMSGGVWGAIDTATIIGMDKLPPEVNKYVQPIVGIAKNVLSGYPTSLGDILNTASGGGLTAAVSGTFNSLLGRNAITPQILSETASFIGSGALGPMGQMFNQFSNLAGIPMAPGALGSLPSLASTAMGALGLGGAVQSLFGGLGGGLGLEGLAALVGGGFNPISTALFGISALSSLFGGAGGDCPCDPKCRKVEHGVDTDGQKLLNPCGSLTSVNANSYCPTGFCLPNNIGEVATDLGLTPTLVGKNLIPPNISDLTQMIFGSQRLVNMAEKFYESRYADEPEKEAEFAYTFENVEKGFKIADNNITRIESIERRLIDSVYNILENFFWKRGPDTAILQQLITDVRENSEALKSIYKFVEALDLAKEGPIVGVNVTPQIALALENIASLTELYEKSKIETTKIMEGGIIPAHLEWETMTPGLGTPVKLGLYNPPMPIVFPNERTLFDEARFLSISLDSKIVDDLQENKPPIDQVLSPNQINTLKDTFVQRAGDQPPSTGIVTPGGVVTQDLPLPEGFVIPEGTLFPEGSSLPTGVPLPAGTTLPSGTVFPPGFVFPGQERTSLYEELKARESGQINCE
jgi:hypothetical protein